MKNAVITEIIVMDTALLVRTQKIKRTENTQMRECIGCDYDYEEDCSEGCMKIKSEDE